MRRYLAENLLDIISNILIKAGIIVIITAVMCLGLERHNLSGLEEIYEESPQVMLEETREFIKEQLQEYIKAHELSLSEEISISEFIKEMAEQSNISIVHPVIKLYYHPTEEERLWAYLMAVAEAGLEDAFGQTLAINVAINRAIETGDSLIEVFTAPGQFSSIHNGVPHLRIVHEDETIEWILVTEDMITDEIREAVDRAFRKDYTEELLKEEAIRKGLDSSYYEGGALYFYNPNAISQEQADSRSNVKVSFQCGNHGFYRRWDS